MNDRTYKVLEYDKIIQIIQKLAISDITKYEIKNLKPFTDLNDINNSLEESFQALEILNHKGSIPMGNFYDVSENARLANAGKTLSMRELLKIGYNLKLSDAVKKYLLDIEEDFYIIKELGELLETDINLYQSIENSIISENEMSDNASASLKKIRKSIAIQNETIKSKIKSIAISKDNKNVLQDSLVTIRQGRYVIPVRAEHKQKIKGIVHGQSAKGSTFFIEPQIVVELNNKLSELEAEEQKEIARILQELSNNVGRISHNIINTQNLLKKIDFIFAKGKYAFANNCKKVNVNNKNKINLINARHPLINKDDVIPVNLPLGYEYETLIITGPNTGGKTVTLKTLGVLTMMVQSGIPIPVDENSEIAIFEKIYADIGDEQSIEQSLSTFSSHMKNIVNIVEEADENTLVLVDELGAGTDPTEGAALAISILEFLREKKAITMATTHYTELKKYAVAQERVKNASMEFDVESLRPTYKMIVGIPGKSNAFEISRKLGLSDYLVDKATKYLNKTDIKFEDLIKNIDKDRKIAEEERDEALELNILMKHQKRELDLKISKINEKKEKILEKARDEAKKIISEAETLTKEVQKSLNEINKSNIVSEKHRILRSSKEKIKEANLKNRETVTVPENYKPVKVDEIKIGDLVKIVSLDKNGDVLSLPDNKGNLSVLVGGIRLAANIRNIMFLENRSKSKKKSSSKITASKMYQKKVINIATNINIVGKNSDEGRILVDKYLDDAFIAGLREVTVIHGRGTGILKKEICNMLKSHSHVEEYRKGTFHEGGDGVTVVVLKKEE